MNGAGQNNMLVVVATIGNRDLLVDGRRAEEWAKAENSAEREALGSCRAMGATVLGDFERYRSRLSTPILEPLIQYAHQLRTEREYRWRHLILVVTDQGAETPPQYRAKDTIEIGKALQRILKQDGRLDGCEVRLLSIKANPTRPDDVAELVAQELRQPSWKFLPEAAAVVLSITGGVPGLNHALFLYLYFEVARDRLHCVHVDESQRRAVPHGFIQRLQRVALRERLASLARIYDFFAIAHELDQAGYALARDLAWYGARRLNFDFQGAQFALSEVERRAGAAVRQRIRPWIEQLVRLTQEDDAARARSLALMRELLANIKIKLARGEWVDVLGRLYRLVEESMKVFVGDALEVDLAFDDREKRYRDYEARVVQWPEALAWFEQQRSPNGREIRWQELNTWVCDLWMQFFLDQTGAGADLPSSDPESNGAMNGGRNQARLQAIKERAGRLRKSKGRLQRLLDLRNKSIMAHGFSPVAESELGDWEKLWPEVLTMVTAHENTPIEELDRGLLEGYDALTSLIMDTLDAD